VVELIDSTRRTEKGQKVSDESLAELKLERADFHGEWNYLIHPCQKLSMDILLMRKFLTKITAPRDYPQNLTRGRMGGISCWAA
jgi:hypothetical protein